MYFKANNASAKLEISLSIFMGIQPEKLKSYKKASMFRYIVIAIGVLILLLIGATALSFLRERAQLKLALSSTPTAQVSTPTTQGMPNPAPTAQAEVVETPVLEETVQQAKSVIYLPLLFVNVSQKATEEIP